MCMQNCAAVAGEGRTMPACMCSLVLWSLLAAPGRPRTETTAVAVEQTPHVPSSSRGVCWVRVLGPCPGAHGRGGGHWFRATQNGRKWTTSDAECRSRMAHVAKTCGSIVEMALDGVKASTRVRASDLPRFTKRCQTCAACIEATRRPLTSGAGDVMRWPRFACEKDVEARLPAGARGAPLRAELVVAHCSMSLGFLSDTIDELRACGVHVPPPSVFVYSKCGHAPLGLPDGATVRNLSNVGRCDHTYALHIRDRYHVHLQHVDVVLFVKDSAQGGGHPKLRRARVSFGEMARVGAHRGFGCRLRPTLHGTFSTLQGEQERSACPLQDIYSDLHVSSVLNRFHLARYNPYHEQLRRPKALTQRTRREPCGDNSCHTDGTQPANNISSADWLMAHQHGGDAWPYGTLHVQGSGSSEGPTQTEQVAPFAAPVGPLGAWAWSTAESAGLGWQSRTRKRLAALVTPVCYGGVFAARGSQLLRVEWRMWAELTRRLERGDNIEESHFVERLWATLLAPQPSASLAAATMAASPHMEGSLHEGVAAERTATHNEQSPAADEAAGPGAAFLKAGLLVGCNCSRRYARRPHHIELPFVLGRLPDTGPAGSS